MRGKLQPGRSGWGLLVYPLKTADESRHVPLDKRSIWDVPRAAEGSKGGSRSIAGRASKKAGSDGPPRQFEGDTERLRSAPLGYVRGHSLGLSERAPTYPKPARSMLSAKMVCAGA